MSEEDNNFDDDFDEEFNEEGEDEFGDEEQPLSCCIRSKALRKLEQLHV